jgi:hypothetical protein
MGGMYAKCGDPAWCIGHAAGEWQFKSTAYKGTAMFCAYVAGGRGLEACSSLARRVFNNSMLLEQQDVT